MSRVAVAIVHGVGAQDADFAEPMISELLDRIARELDTDRAEAARRVVIEPVHWAPVLSDDQTRLWRAVSQETDLDFVRLRRFMIDFVGDGIAYQPTAHDRTVYDDVHATMARTLHTLATRAGEEAPLCVVAHSLGTVIASNYFYDLARLGDASRPGLVSDEVRAHIGEGPLERGETLTWLWTLGSPLAVWALHHQNFGKPVEVPSEALRSHHPELQGGWRNFFDKDDVIGYPLKPLNDAYDQAVTEDVAVDAGGFFTSWSPLSHNNYWTDRDIVRPIARDLAEVWRSVQG